MPVDDHITRSFAQIRARKALTIISVFDENTSTPSQDKRGPNINGYKE